MLESIDAYHTIIPGIWGWDLVYFGALGAISWAAAATSFFVRRLSVAVLALLCLDMLFFGLAIRGYIGLVWPHLSEWMLTYVNAFGHAGVALYALIFFSLGRQEGVRLPGGMGLAWLAGVQLAAALVIFAYPGFGRLGSPALNLVSACILLGLALVALQRKVPARWLVLLTNMLVAFRLGGSAIERLARTLGLPHPENIVMHSPLVSISGLALNLTLLASWVAYVSKQRRAATDALVGWQAQEKTRLEAEVARQTQALNQALEYANQANQRKTEGLSYISHDLRAPLSSIVGYADLLAQTQTEAQRPHIRSIVESVNYQLALIDDLLEYSRAEHEPFVLRPDAVCLHSLLDAVTRHARGFSTRQNNHFQLVPPVRFPPLVMIDGRRLQQVLLNLLVNSSKFTYNGTITLTVIATPAGADWVLQFSVEDTGIGMALDAQARVFNAYSQVDPLHGGVGLGLYIARHIVEAMGARLELSSTLGAGSRFSFEITVSAAHSAGAPDKVPEPQNWVQPEVSMGTPGQYPMPPAHTRVRLAILARDGQLTKIEEWLATMGQQYPGYESFLAEIRAALQMLDFEYIEALALTADPSAVDLNTEAANEGGDWLGEAPSAPQKAVG